MKKNQLGAVCGFLVCLLVSIPSANGALFNVDYNDFTGPHWTGVIDTASDKLSINTWTETAGFPDYWTPSSLPLVWDAIDSGGSIFDVPDDWNGSLGINWGFMSPVVLSAMSFNEGTSTINNMKPGWHIHEINGGIQGNVGQNKMGVWLRASNFVFASEAESVQITAAPAVPIPPALWLFGSGLLGLVGVAKRKKA